MTATPGKIVRMYSTGAPDVLKIEDMEIGPPMPGEVQVQHKAIGLNFIEVYWRSGVYPLPLPTCIGNEGAGVVLAVGEGVNDFKPGDPRCLRFRTDWFLQHSAQHARPSPCENPRCD
jgi:NADPH:quinone reductase-like Zn-dependent oxidoreductase